MKELSLVSRTKKKLVSEPDHEGASLVSRTKKKLVSEPDY